MGVSRCVSNMGSYRQYSVMYNFFKSGSFSVDNVGELYRSNRLRTTAIIIIHRVSFLC